MLGGGQRFGEPGGTLNLDFINFIAQYDLVSSPAGQSHCVLETTRSSSTTSAGPELIRRWRVLTDCTSSVAHPEVDFEAMANRHTPTSSTYGLHCNDSRSARLASALFSSSTSRSPAYG